MQVIGHFLAALRTPLPADLGFAAKDAKPITLSDARIILFPQEPSRQSEDGELPAAYVEALSVTISKDVASGSLVDVSGGLALSRQVRDDFERDLCMAVQKFMRRAKLTLKLYWLNSDQPVASYSYRFLSEDNSLLEQFPLREGHRLVPRESPAYLFARLPIRLMISAVDLDATSWERIAATIDEKAIALSYEENLADARGFAHSGHLPAAVLYSGIAAEGILRSLCESASPSRDDVKRVKKKAKHLEDLSAKQLLLLAKALAERHVELPHLTIGVEEECRLRKHVLVFRNPLAHGTRSLVTIEQAAAAIRTVEALAEHVRGVPES